jgi:hypothetical protein
MNPFREEALYVLEPEKPAEKRAAFAEQTEPVRRRVALKVIKLGMDTKQVVRCRIKTLEHRQQIDGQYAGGHCKTTSS